MRTEPPFTGKYWDCEREGTYHCNTCGRPLFSSKAKYDSGTGWPSFWDVLPNAIGLDGNEVHCEGCRTHLGHVFPDGPRPTGQRYCINSYPLDLRGSPQ